MQEPDDGAEQARHVGFAAGMGTAFEEMPVSLAALEGADHRFVAANAAYRTMVGRTELVGRLLRDVMPELAAQQLFELMAQVYETGRGYSGHEWRIQIDQDGDGRAEDRFLTFALAPWHHPDWSRRGVLAVVSDVTDLVVARRAAEQAARQAAEEAQQARSVIHTLQRALLPPALPVAPGARIAGSYLLADDGPGAVPGDDAGGAAGGDWFDAVLRPDGRVALAVGDVVGHGVSASAVMGQLRAVLTDRLLDGTGLPAALGAADRLARRTPGAHATTVCVALLDPSDGSLVYCTAGHPPPLLVPAGAEAGFLPPTGAAPLGTGRGGDDELRFPLGTAHLDLDDLVLLYTDGIVERPGRSPSVATVELARVAADAAAGRALDTDETSPPERVCTHGLELLVRETGHVDDVTLLAAQRVRPVPGPDLVLPAEPATVAAVRAAMGDWLAAVGAAAEDAFALQHAVGELVTNCVEHAYRGAAVGTVAVRADLTVLGEVRVRVSDGGRWREAQPEGDRGRGLALSRGLVDDLDVVAGHGDDGGGTTATVAQRLSRPARLLTTAEITAGAASAAAVRSAASDGLEILDGPPADGEDRILVTGVLDVVTAPVLHRELRRRTRGGTRALTLDLTGVSVLASAAVSVLHDTATTAAPLRLYAPAGSVAHHVLELVQLAHTTSDPAVPADPEA
jgi:PAS domain S-box-containing protein